MLKQTPEARMTPFLIAFSKTSRWLEYFSINFPMILFNSDERDFCAFSKAVGRCWLDFSTTLEEPTALSAWLATK
ncbi:hypothetical protein EC545_04675 [Helicobacter pylori]|nr:hypothetical protein EC545_04675 [Helicobacter pylori]